MNENLKITHKKLKDRLFWIAEIFNIEKTSTIKSWIKKGYASLRDKRHKNPGRTPNYPVFLQDFA
jgi:hypothetical protein